MEAKDTKNLTEMVDLILTAVEVFGDAKADGKIDAQDLGLLLKLIPQVGPALDGAAEIPAEVKDLSAEEASALVAHVMAKLTIGDEKARTIVEKALKLGVAGLELAAAIKA
jgi:hypothetical protein